MVWFWVEPRGLTICFIPRFAKKKKKYTQQTPSTSSSSTYDFWLGARPSLRAPRPLRPINILHIIFNIVRPGWRTLRLHNEAEKIISFLHATLAHVRRNNLCVWL